MVFRLSLIWYSERMTQLFAYIRRIFYFFGTATVTSEAISIRVTVSECIIWQNTRYTDGKAVRR